VWLDLAMRLDSASRKHSVTVSAGMDQLFVWHPEVMPISARNQLEGKVLEVKLGEIMAHVVVKIGKNQIESVITRRSAEELSLKKGDKVMVIIKSTEVMLQKD
jgi:molybdopterin-binding protein